jgi:hypothetical protein
MKHCGLLYNCLRYQCNVTFAHIFMSHVNNGQLILPLPIDPKSQNSAVTTAIKYPIYGHGLVNREWSDHRRTPWALGTLLSKSRNLSFSSRLNCFLATSSCSIHADGSLVNPKVRAKFLVTDFGYPRACRFRKHQILNRRSLLYQLFKKRDFYFINVAKIGKNGPKMEFFEFFEISHFLKCNCSKTALMCSTTWKKRENSRKSLKIGQF